MNPILKEAPFFRIMRFVEDSASVASEIQSPAAVLRTQDFARLRRVYFSNQSPPGKIFGTHVQGYPVPLASEC